MNSALLQQQLLAIDRDLVSSPLFEDGFTSPYYGPKPPREERLAKLHWFECNWHQLDAYFDLVNSLTVRGFVLILSGAFQNLLAGNNGLSESIFVGLLLNYPIHHLNNLDGNQTETAIILSHISTLMSVTCPPKLPSI